MLRWPLAIWTAGLGAVLMLSSASCTRGQCPAGQRFEENWYGPAQPRSRGCVGRDAGGNERRQGRWEFFYESGKLKAQSTVHDGKLDGVGTTWYENGQKESEATYSDGEVVPGTRQEWDESGNPVP